LKREESMSKPPFDTVKASFYLVSFVIGVHASVVLIGALLCAYEVISLSLKSDCDARGRLGDLLAGALASALAFAGGLIRGRGKRKDDDENGS